jgi:hypothetical protein
MSHATDRIDAHITQAITNRDSVRRSIEHKLGEVARLRTNLASATGLIDDLLQRRQATTTAEAITELTGDHEAIR